MGAALSNGDFSVGDWLVEASLARIRRGEETVRVTPRAMAVLVYLAEAKGAVRSRNEILDAVWPRMAVSQDALSQCIVELRKAFGDDSKNPKVIETIPKKGVRLIAPVVGPKTLLARELLGTASSMADRAPVASDETSSEERPAGAADREPARGSLFAELRRRQVFTGSASSRRAWLWASCTTLVLAIALGATTFWPADRSIAVLPFEYESTADESVQSFASNIHEELLSRLGKIAAFDKVIAYRAVVGYRGTEKSIREIGREFGVATILAGRFQDGALKVELIDTETNARLWGDTYPNALSVEDLFAIQSKIVLSIADELGAALSPDELARVRNVPTKNQDAYEFYVWGNERWRRNNERDDNLKSAAQQYSIATQLDPNFVSAWARLAIVETGLYWNGSDTTPERLASAGRAIQEAFDLDPDSGEAHVAKANYLSRIEGNYAAALAQFAIAEQSIPHDPLLYFLRASVHRRLGDWHASTADHDKALELDPNNPVYLRQQHVNYLVMRDYGRAEENLDRVLEIAPEDNTAYVDKVVLAIYRDGDTSLAKRYEDEAPTRSYTDERSATHVRWLAAIFDGDYAKAKDVLDSERRDWMNPEGDLGGPKELYYGRMHVLAGDQELARDEFESAKEKIERDLADVVDGSPARTIALHLALAETQAALGQSQAKDVLNSLNLLYHSTESQQARLAFVVRVLLPLGENERAIEELDAYLSAPGGQWSIEGLAKDPQLHAIRNEPGFIALIEKYSRR